MSNKIKLQEHATDLQFILDTINALPEEGAGDAFAVIGVTYPEGSICTCSNGVETLELDDTIGYGFFLIPEAGEWTVTATDGTNSKSQSVSITTEGQWESVELSYAVYLFKSGEGAKVDFLTYNDKDGTASITVGTETITVNASSSTGGFRTALRTKETIDFKKYTALKMKCTPTAVYTNSYSSGWENSFGVTSTAFTSSEPSTISWAARTKIAASLTEIIFTVDISSITTSLYFALHFCGKMTATEIWLE